MPRIDPEESTTVVVSNLSALILSAARSLASENQYPVSDPDESDARIKRNTKRVETLRAMRTTFEDLMAE